MIYLAWTLSLIIVAAGLYQLLKWLYLVIGWILIGSKDYE